MITTKIDLLGTTFEMPIVTYAELCKLPPEQQKIIDENQLEIIMQADKLIADATVIRNK